MECELLNMIHGILENFNISWKERLGTGMKRTNETDLEDIVFRHEQVSDNVLLCTHLKNNVPENQDVYETDSFGRLKKQFQKTAKEIFSGFMNILVKIMVCLLKE